MIRRFLQSRGAQKFRRDRMAMTALVVITGYFLVAILVSVFGVVSVQDTKERILPDRVPGFLESVSFEKQLKFAEWWYKHLEPLRNEAVYEDAARLEQALIDSIDLAERRAALRTPDEVRAAMEGVEVAWEAYEGPWKAYDEAAGGVVALENEIAERNAEGKEVPEQFAEMLADFREQLVTLRPEIEEALVGLDDAIAQLLPEPQGWGGFVYGMRTLLGSDSRGSSISAQAVFSVKIAFQIGLVTSLISVLIGTLLGAAAAFYGGWVDHLVMWIVSVFSSIPYLVLLAVIAYMFTGSIFDTKSNPALALFPVYVAFCSVFWISTCRVIRGEVLKIKELEYVQAATAIGFSRFYILRKHVVPNTAHLMFINFSLLFVGAIKSEVILSYLGLGVKGQSSWGVMINHGADAVQGFFFWEVGAATVFMFGLVLAFNVVSDALQDAFDPKHVG